MSGIPEATPVRLTDEERTELEALARSTKTEHRLRQRARIVLMAADGEPTRRIARAVGCTIGTASKWRVRFAEKRFAGLDETGDRGAEPKYTGETNRRILAVLDGSPPAGFARWTGRLIAKALGDVDVQYVWRFLRAQKIDLSGRKSWCTSEDPEFAAKAAEIVGLYLDPPDNALVLAIDEKPHIQALERAQGYLKLPNGRALTGHSHDYKRHGTSTLFAALDVANGEITARHYRRRRRLEFLDFMNHVVAAHPAAKSMSFSTISTPTNLNATTGSAGTRRCISTSHPPTPPGSTKWNAGSPSWPASRSRGQASPVSLNSGHTSMPSSAVTTKLLVPSPGQNPRSIRSVSSRVSPTCDSGY